MHLIFFEYGTRNSKLFWDSIDNTPAATVYNLYDPSRVMSRILITIFLPPCHVYWHTLILFVNSKFHENIDELGLCAERNEWLFSFFCFSHILKSFLDMTLLHKVWISVFFMRFGNFRDFKSSVIVTYNYWKEHLAVSKYSWRMQTQTLGEKCHIKNRLYIF